MSLLEIVGVFLAEAFGPEAVLELAFPAALLAAAFLGWFFSSPVAASLVLAPAGAVCALVGWTRGRRAGAPPVPVYLGPLPDARVLVSGRALALTAADAQVFVLDDGQGRALVWAPEGSEGGFDPERPVSVVGRAGRFADMMGDLVRAGEPAPELLKALQTRAELRTLPCFWPGADAGFSAAARTPEEAMSAFRDPGGIPRAAGAALMVFAAVLFLGRVFRVF